MATTPAGQATKPRDENRGRRDPKSEPGPRIPVGEPAYNRAVDFLIEEARLLDDGHLNDWADLLAEDIHYRMPTRESVFRAQGPGFDPGMNWLFDDILSLRFKVKRMMDTDTAWAEDPPSRVRRLVTNVTVFQTPNPDEFEARSYLLLQRNRGEAATFDTFSARRDDILRRTPDGLRLARRLILLDQATIGMANIAVFL